MTFDVVPKLSIAITSVLPEVIPLQTQVPLAAAIQSHIPCNSNMRDIV